MRITFPINPGAQGHAVADLQDAFQLCLDKGALLANDPASRASLSAALKKERVQQVYGEATRKLVASFQLEHHINAAGIAPSGEVDGPTAEALNKVIEAVAITYTVQGSVMDASGLVVPRLTVKVFDRDIGAARDLLGTASTDASGRFSVTFHPPSFMAGDVDTPDLIFEVSTAAVSVARPLFGIDYIDRLPLPGEKAAPLPSRISGADLALGIEGRMNEIIRIVLSPASSVRAPSEFAGLIGKLKPVLARLPSGNPADFDEIHQDITFAAREIGAAHDVMEDLVTAFRIAREKQMARFEPSLFYGLARIKGLRSVASIAASSVDTIAAGLAAASSNPPNVIDAIGTPDDILGRATQLHAAALAWRAQAPDAQNRATFSQTLTAAGLSADDQTSLLSVHSTHGQSAESFWAQLASLSAFSDPAKLKKLEFTLQADLLGGMRPSFLTAVQRSGRFSSVRDLALNLASTVDLVKSMPEGELTDIAGATVDEKRANYGNQVIAVLQAAFPTETVGLGVKAAAKGGQAHTLTAVSDFLLMASDPGRPAGQRFDINSSHVDRFVAQHGDALLGKASNASRAAIVAGIKRAQRLFRLSTSPMTFGVLHASSHQSAHSIASVPRSSFVAQYEAPLGGADVAELIHKRATSTAMIVTELMIQVETALNGANPRIAGGN